MQLKPTLYTAIDGTTVQVTYASKESLEKNRGSLTDDEYKEIVTKRDVPIDAKNVLREIDPSILPKDDDLFNAWEIDPKSKKIIINAVKAKATYKEQCVGEMEVLVIERDKMAALGADTSKLDEEIAILKKKYNNLHATDVSSIDTQKDLSANNAVLEQLKSIHKGEN